MTLTATTAERWWSSVVPPVSVAAAVLVEVPPSLEEPVPAEGDVPPEELV